MEMYEMTGLDASYEDHTKNAAARITVSIIRSLFCCFK